MTNAEALPRMTTPTGHPWRSLGVSLVTMVVAFFIMMLAGRNVGLGPLDLSTADRLALGLWVAAPVVGGLLGRGADSAYLARVAITLGVIVGVCVALFFVTGSGTGYYVCSVDLGMMPRPIGCMLVGGLTGAGIAIGFLISGVVSSRRPITGVTGIAAASAIVLGASLGAKDLFYEAVRCLQ